MNLKISHCLKIILYTWCIQIKVSYEELKKKPSFRSEVGHTWMGISVHWSVIEKSCGSLNYVKLKEKGGSSSPFISENSDENLIQILLIFQIKKKDIGSASTSSYEIPTTRLVYIFVKMSATLYKYTGCSEIGGQYFTGIIQVNK